ncbi:MAG: hypothetical protein KF847_06215 [Pirellulales bacterium]|nr:hypothetical protein [Pirellulales bacterium]
MCCYRDCLKSLSLSASAALVAGALCGSAGAADWGTIKGRFVLDGEVKPAPVKVDKDTAFCGPFKLVNESVVQGENGGLANVFVYCSSKSVAVHPDYESAAKTVVLDNNQCRFEPHAMTVWTKQPLEIRNSDQGIGHNTNAQNLVVNAKFNEQVTNDKPIVKEFQKSEPVPTEFACNVHPWMNALVLIRDNPYMVVSGNDGSFELANVPAGKHEFIIWHETKGNIRDLVVGGEKTNRKGRIDLTVKGGETLDLGDIKVTKKQLGL